MIPTYELYGSDTWHIKPSLTITYGLNWGVAMPPYEINGKQVEMLNQATGQPIEIQQYLEARQSAALAGQVYQPQISFATIKNVNGGADKYPYNPFYGGFSPRVSLAWNPRFGTDSWLGKILGDGKTVIRGGYARIYGRLNGVDLMLVPLLGPGLLQAVSCPSPTMTGVLHRRHAGHRLPYRRGWTHGSAAGRRRPGQPDHPNAAAALHSGRDPKRRPEFGRSRWIAARSDREAEPLRRSQHHHSALFRSRTMLEVGYIGRKISNEFQEINLDAVP